MAPTRRKPTKRKNREESIGVAADALSVDELREDSAEAFGSRDFGSDGFATDAFRSSAAQGEAHDEVFDGEGFDNDNCGEEAPRKPRRLSRFHIVLIVVLAVLIAIEGGFCLLRWAPDDAADMQGTWYVNESTKTISITDEVIVLAEDVAYEYDIDEAAKTIVYQFGIMEGSGRYRFSLDRTQLAIMDGEFTFSETLMSDISWTFEALLAHILGEPMAPGSGDSVALLTRAPFEEGAPLPDGASGEGEASAEGDPSGEGGSAEESASPGEGESQEGASSEQAGDSQSGKTPEEGSEPGQGGASQKDKLTVVDKLVVSDKPLDA